ncbi:hypothetical protein ABH991_008543 [Bradyrhizobium ottawaense]|uniref:Uncharacterized protein n=1 Tax=Bradyrhizobium ottawaense TaxID=931866 RepID=A0ABV4FJR1_9BRAD
MLPSPLLSDSDERITRIRFFARNQSLTGAKYCWTILAVGIGCRASMAPDAKPGRLEGRPRSARQARSVLFGE